MKEWRKPEYPEKNPDDELQKMPHTKARNFKPQLRLERANHHTTWRPHYNLCLNSALSIRSSAPAAHLNFIIIIIIIIFFFFFYVSQLYLWGSPFGLRFLPM